MADPAATPAANADATHGTELVFVVPGPLDKPTGGYGYDRRLIAGLAAQGYAVEVVHLPDVFPFPSPTDVAAAETLLVAVAAGRPVIVDGLAYGVLPAAMRALAARGPLIALVHHPLALETGLDAETAARLRASEHAALAAADAVVVTSPATARTLIADFAVPAERITVAVPGTDRPTPRFDPRRRDPNSAAPPRNVEILSVGSVIPRKGHVALVEALGRLADLDWRLVILGAADLDPAETARLDAAIAATGLGARIRRLGPVPRTALETFYDGADLFVLNSSYEGYGMAYAEAIAHGLPVVGTTGGAIAETVGDGAVLVAPGDTAALEAALRRLVADAEARRILTEAARTAAARLPDWDHTARTVASAIAAATRTAEKREAR